MSVDPILRRLARKHGLDERAVIAVALGEGGLSPGWHVGDKAGGGSYGPFQLYAQGALPQRFRGRPKRANQWAWSPKGMDYALRQMVKAGAGGLSGPQAVETIIRKFERPANPDRSVQLALSRYGGVESGGAAPPERPVRAQALSSPTSVSAPGPDLQALRSNVLTALLADRRSGGGRSGSLAALGQFAEARDAPRPAPVAAPTAAPTAPAAPRADLEPGGGWGGSYAIAQGLASIGQQHGLRVTSEKRDRQATASGGVSDHWSGSKTSYAFDLSGSPEQMDEAARRIMRALGADYKGGALVRNINTNGYRVQVIYRSNVGGNHYDHIHVGVRRLT